MSLNRYAVISDIHLEYRSKENVASVLNYLSGQEGDGIFVAGDVCPIVQTELFEDFFRALYGFTEVFYVPGNHEYYGTSLSEGEVLIKNSLSKFSNVKAYLSDSNYLLNYYAIGSSFDLLATTLWYNPDNPDVYLLQSNLNDFKYISNTIQDFTQLSNDILSRIDREYLNAPYVLLTHHLPYTQCLHPNYRNDRLNCYFVNDLSKVLSQYPLIVIHGHTHLGKSHYKINNSHSYVICNPQPDKDIELEWFTLNV